MRISSSTTDYTETLRILFQGKITSNYKFTNQPWHLMELLTNLMNTKNLVKYLQNNHYPNTWINLIKLLMVSCSWLRSAEQNQLAGWLAVLKIPTSHLIKLWSFQLNTIYHRQLLNYPLHYSHEWTQLALPFTLFLPFKPQNLKIIPFLKQDLTVTPETTNSSAIQNSRTYVPVWVV